MGKLNFFASADALNALLALPYEADARPPLDLTLDVIELPFWFSLHCGEKTQTLKLFTQMELYSKNEEMAVEKGSVVLDGDTGNAAVTAPEVLSDNMGAFYALCRNLSLFAQEKGLDELWADADPDESGILLTEEDGEIRWKLVSGMDRPELTVERMFGGTIKMRPYMSDFWDRSETELMSLEEKIEKAEGGDLFAIAQLAEAYLNGDDEVEQDPAKAAYWYRREAEQENSEGAFNLGLLYAKGFGVERDFAQAAEWMEKAVAWGDPDGEGPAKLYRGIDENLKKAESGDAAAMAELAGGYMMLGGSLDQAGAGDDYAQSLHWAQKAVDAGCAAGYWPLALAYEHGRGVEQDDQKAVAYYQKGAELGDPNCQHSYGCRLINGDGVKKDAAQALALFERSAEQGYALAYQALAHMYETGEGVEPDFDKELEYFEKACEAEPNNAELMRHAGFQYTNLMDLDEAHWLRGVQRAAYWLRRAADLGDMAAIHGADMYEKILALHEEGKIPAGTSMGDCMRILSENGMPAEEAAPFSPFADPDWEEQWKKEREEYERKAAKEWLAAHEQDLDRGAKIVFADKKFVFDGTPDAELFDEVLAKLAERGGVHRGAVSGKTDYLVCEPRRAGESKLRNLKEQRMKGRCMDTKVVLAEDFYRALGYDPEPEIRVEEPEEETAPEETAPETEPAAAIEPESVFAPRAEDVETNEKGLPLATPGEDQHPQLDYLSRMGGVMSMFGAMVNQTGTECEFYSLRDDGGYSEPVASALKRAVQKDRGSFALAERAKEMAEVFRMEIDCFDPGEDREQQILNGMIRRSAMYNDLRSFAWTLTAYCAANAVKPADVDVGTLRAIARLVQEKDHLNYRADSYCPALCSGPDIHVYFLPDATAEADRKLILDKLNEGSEGIGLSAISSLDGLRAELAALAPAMEKIHAALAATRDRRRELSGAMADVLFAWCSMTYAARDPIFVEDGPVNNFFEHPDQKNAWEEQWKKQREEYERQAAEEWLKAHEKDLNRGAKITFSGKKFVFDGSPDGDQWLEILEKLTAKGGVHRAAVSGQTDYLVCDPRRAGEAKIRDVKEQRINGRCQDTKIVLAEDFYRALGFDPNPPQTELAPEPEQKAAPLPVDAPMLDSALKLTFENGVRRGDGHYTIGIPDGFSINENAEGRAFIAYSPDGADEFDGRVILFDGERNEIEADVRSQLSPKALCSLLEGAAYNETLAQMFEEVGSISVPEQGPMGFASYGIDTNMHCYHCNVVLILGNARKQLRMQIGDVYHEDIPACEAMVHDWLQTLQTDETSWKIPQTDDPEFAGALTNQLAERWAEVQSTSLGALIGEYNAARDTRVQKYRTLSAKGRDSVEALKRDLKTMLGQTGKQFRDHFDRALTVLERLSADERNRPYLRVMLDSVKKELPESDRLTLTLDGETIEASIPDLDVMKKRHKRLVSARVDAASLRRYIESAEKKFERENSRKLDQRWKDQRDFDHVREMEKSEMRLKELNYRNARPGKFLEEYYENLQRYMDMDAKSVTQTLQEIDQKLESCFDSNLREERAALLRLLRNWCREFATIRRYVDGKSYERDLTGITQPLLDKWKQRESAILRQEEAERLGIPESELDRYHDYEKAVKLQNAAATSRQHDEAAAAFRRLSGYRDSDALRQKSEEQSKSLLAVERAAEQAEKEKRKDKVRLAEEKLQELDAARKEAEQKHKAWVQRCDELEAERVEKSYQYVEAYRADQTAKILAECDRTLKAATEAKELYQNQISQVEEKLSALGLFAFGEKKALRAEIEQLKQQIAEAEAVPEAAEETKNQQLEALNGTVETERQQKLKQLQTELPAPPEPEKPVAKPIERAELLEKIRGIVFANKGVSVPEIRLSLRDYNAGENAVKFALNDLVNEGVISVANENDHRIYSKPPQPETTEEMQSLILRLMDWGVLYRAGEIEEMLRKRLSNPPSLTRVIAYLGQMVRDGRVTETIERRTKFYSRD